MAGLGILSLVWTRVTTYDGSSVAPPSSIAALAPGLSLFDTRVGVYFAVEGVAVLIGPPITGTITKDTAG